MTTSPVELWTPDHPYPAINDIPLLDDVRHMVMYRGSRADAFLHGVALVEHKGRLYCSWASSPVDENSTEETLVCSTSDDDGLSWSPPAAIGPGYPGERNHSHCSFLSRDGRLWAFTASFLRLRTQDKVFPGLRAEGLLLNEDSGSWDNVGIIAQNFWPYEEPKQMPNGHWIMGGQDEDANTVVAISEGDFSTWERVAIPTPDGVTLRFGETATFVGPEETTAIIRYPAGLAESIPQQTALVSASKDFGRSWSVATASNLPAGDSKLYAGALSDGRRYLVYNGDTADKRSSLLIATSLPGEQDLSHVWRVQYGYPPEPRFKGYGKSRQWSYPYAIEHRRSLIVGYSINKEDCGLSIIPVDRLRVHEEELSDH